ncbi:toxin-antitoxin system HicB family antitoxin [Geodermatophilus ruber]|uniref:HicB family protein n=1 Tax=Geodermatophilus ruber TaxID=504800 RepID=A0A1I3ZZB9_9ACTN|nr:toxin-antitoxin system HicB family antitoxin [Geodermatophilus ruber]SFK49455.1 HicB family protein [Geodermatophilus ruber]
MAALDLSPHVEALRASLTAVAAAGTEQTRETAMLLATSMEPAVRLVLLDVLSAMAAGVTAAWDGGEIDVRLRGGEPEVVVVPAAPTPPVDEADADAALARISLRLPEPLKARAEQAAAADGTSLNTWLVRAVGAALREPGHGAPLRGPRRFSGFARS